MPGPVCYISWIWSILTESATNLINLRWPFQIPELNYCTLTQNRWCSSNTLCIRCTPSLRISLSRVYKLFPKQTYINNLDATFCFVLQVVYKLACCMVIHVKYALCISQNNTIKSLPCKSNLKRYIDSSGRLIVSELLHGVERIQIDAVW